MMNSYIWDLWMKKFDNYEVDGVASIEWYSEGNTSSINYESQIWIPIKRKQKLIFNFYFYFKIKKLGIIQVYK